MTPKRRHTALCAAVALATLLPPSVAMATGDQALFGRANAAYDEQNYAQAVADYEEILSHGSDSGWVYYNLGNSYLRQGHLGRAIAAYVRSEVRLPRNSDVRANLSYARAQARDALAPAEPSPVVRSLFFWHYALSYHELVYVTAAVHGLFWLALGLRVWYRQVAAWRLASYVLGTMWVAVGCSLLLRSRFPQEIMVVNNREIEVHSGTSYDTVVRFKLHEGTQGRVVDTEDTWLRIELSDGKQGWVPAGDVVKITLY
jgi:tetratricopeptide (TPR) repeat protein